MNNTCLIHNNNIGYEDYFDKEIKFSLGTVDIDKYISQNIIPKVKDKNPSIIYIKDNLSSNYLELYGLRVAYHIRLSSELSFNQRCLPIVIISDVGIHTLNKLSVISNILYTKNIFTIKNDINVIKNFNTEKIKSFKSENEYQDKFLNKIEIKPPKESSHDITNEWAIFKWAKELKITDPKKRENIDKVTEKVSHNLYFKYLIALFSIEETIELKNSKFKKVAPKLDIKKDTKVLYIDDEWNKGWKEILEYYFSSTLDNPPITLEIDYTNKGYNDLEPLVIEKIEEEKPDLIILDMRLIENDHTEDIEAQNISGIKLLNQIKSTSLNTKLNPGIQVIMFTASGNSSILNEANKEKIIIDYIKKDSPSNNYIPTIENINKLSEFIKSSEEKFFLKEIWKMQKDILSLELFNISQYNAIKKELGFIFEILNSNMDNKFKFSMLTIYKILEIIKDLYINDKAKYQDKDGSYKIEIKAICFINNMYQGIDKKSLEKNPKQYGFDDTIDPYGKIKKTAKQNAQAYYYSTKNKIKAILYEKLKFTENRQIHEQIENISNKRNTYIHPDKGHSINVDINDITEWFKVLKMTLFVIDRQNKSI